jgi:DNA-directed RNA polymerase specialized sigma24 family protein
MTNPWYIISDSNILPEWEVIWPGCVGRIRRWRLPPRWSVRDWWEEVLAQGLAAAWEALCDYDPERGVARERFMQGRVLARVLQLYRREWAYGRRCDPELPTDRGKDRPGEPESAGLVRAEGPEWLAHLPGADRRLLERLFVDGWTEAEAARELGISQPAISKRKRLILSRLRLLSESKCDDSTIAGYKREGLPQ